MSATHTTATISGYRAEVEERLSAGDEFGAVETAIDQIEDLSEDQKSALWLFAFSKRDLAGRRMTTLAAPSLDLG